MALTEKGQADIQTPKTAEKRKQSEYTPTPPECNPMHPKRKASKDDSDSWTEVKTRKNKGQMTPTQRTTDAVAAGKTSKSKRRNYRCLDDLDEVNAAKLELDGHVQIGWVRCRVTRRQTVTRCVHCHGFNHIAASCKEKNRSKTC